MSNIGMVYAYFKDFSCFKLMNNITSIVNIVKFLTPYIMYIVWFILLVKKRLNCFILQV